MDLTLCAPCLLGLEGLVSDELRRMGMKNVRAQNGRVLFDGDMESAVRANLCLRTAERVLIRLGGFRAVSFEELFEGVKALPWEAFIPKNGTFPVVGHSLDSKLASVPSCQSIIKKAVVERLKLSYRTDWFREDGPLYRIRFSLQNDEAVLYLDTSGSALHKRGYRPQAGAAPLRETLAAAMVILSRYRGGGFFDDPFCGSGTLPIEAALIARNRAPGLNRRFDAQVWDCAPKPMWDRVREAARAAEYNKPYHIRGGDIDAGCVELARANAVRAGVGDCVRFERADAYKYTVPAEARPGDVTIVTNPPYGERLEDVRAAENHYKALAAAAPGEARLLLLSPHPAFERVFGRGTAKKRKLYNGMIRCNLYMYGVSGQRR